MSTESTIEVTFDPDKPRMPQIEEDIAKFDEFFQSLDNDSLAKPERAILTTYLLYKTHTREEIEALRKR